MATVAKSVAHVQTLSPVLTHALMVAGKQAAKVRDELSPGRHVIDTTVRIVGTLAVGENTVTSSTTTPKAVEVLAYVLSKQNKVTREKILAELSQGPELSGVDPMLVAATEAALMSLRRTVPQHRHGAVTGDFTVEPVGHDATSAPTEFSVVG